MNSSQAKKILFVSFALTVVFGFTLLSLIFLPVRAASVNINATVSGTSVSCGNGVAEAGEACDGTDDADSCYNGSCNSDCTCPVCGDNAIEAGEECEADSDCASGEFCNDSCGCQVVGPSCIPVATTCSYGACVAGTKSGFCTNGCSSWPVSQPCVVPGCGNGVIEAGEECDDTNLVSGDGCSASCQLEFGCGNASIDPGEQCDDGNVVGGDCCSGSCQSEILITGVSVSTTNTSAAVSWTTPCQSTGSLLEWGKTVAVSEGSASLSGGNYSHAINGLTPNTVYFYRITATSGSLQAVHNGSFLTTGGVENCTNGLDDDNDGFCDYPASNCSDSSTPGDPECSCSPNFICTPQACNNTTGKQTVDCVDQTVPKCESDYSYEQDCDVCPGVTCGPCQDLDANSCSCVVRPNCCGNGNCEPPGEDPYSCVVDCPADCLSDWECSDWSPAVCPTTGIQTRDCFDKNACPVPINKPATSQTCGGVCVGLSCGTCQAIDAATCTCVEQVTCCGNGICESGENHVACAQDCVEACQPNWTCNGWGACANGVQSRECYDLNNCNLNLDRPPEVRACGGDCEVACSTCQQIDLGSCSCLATTPCCGNNSCETNETVWSCPVDCGLPPEFRLTLTKCLDGLDNDGDGLTDYPADPGCTKPSDSSELNLTEVFNNVSEVISDVVVDQVLNNPVVETANETIAPVLVTAVAVNTFATFSFFNFFSYVQFFVTQPFAVLFRRKRRKWGVVYNSLTKQPVDLAIVRLYRKDNGQLVRSQVTDKDGRYSFLIDPGKYYMTVTKPKYDFPTQHLKDEKEDVRYLDLYHGEDVDVTEQRADITANIPIDPIVEEKPVARVILQYYLRKVQYIAAFSAIPLAAISMIISPGTLTFVMFGFHCLLYVLFRRLGYQKPPKNWGIVYDSTNKRPVGRAIARIYDKKYNKLLETRVTDSKGRYSFLVNNNVYYVTAEKLGYKQAKTSDIDLSEKGKDAVVGMDIPLEKGQGVTEAPAPEIKPAAPLPAKPPADKVGLPAVSATQPTHEVDQPVLDSDDIFQKLSHLEVGRESLEELIKAKKEVEQIEAEVEDRQENLEQLEEKIDDIKENLEEKIAKLNQSKDNTPKPATTTSAPKAPEPPKPQSGGEKPNIFG
ncbi:MAG: carboxypeptidase regulatory-like domain-containing protein [Candidatus Buchananbacteria bacterium]|nr:carboxypeptidase regulatory-like domain-containing protein [Candidatus Buchananbacteria bacterium]